MVENFQNKKNWLFDLDNTLYSPTLGIFSQIDLRMKKFISNKIGVTETHAFEIQKKFYKQYGTTLYGLTKHYNINPDEFLNFVHNICLKNLNKCDALRKKIIQLPGRKFIYTNGDSKYAAKILKSLGLNNIFSDIFDIKKANYFPKPMKTSLNKLIKNYDIKPNEIVYFDDLQKNLKTAFLKGITTVLISSANLSEKSYIDFRFKSIINALDMIIKTLNKKY